jgi:DNA-binding XRE family transcriptional regulator
MDKGIFQVDLAKTIGVDEMTIVNWEIRGRIPCPRHHEKLMRAVPEVGGFLTREKLLT